MMKWRVRKRSSCSSVDEEVKTCLALLDSMLSEFDTSLPSSPTTKNGVLATVDPSIGNGIVSVTNAVIESSTYILKVTKDEQQSPSADHSSEEKECETFSENGIADFPLVDVEVTHAVEHPEVDDEQERKAPPIPARSPTTRLSSSSNSCPSPILSVSSPTLSISSDSVLSGLSTASPASVSENSEVSIQPEVVCVNGIAYVPVNYPETPANSLVHKSTADDDINGDYGNADDRTETLVNDVFIEDKNNNNACEDLTFPSLSPLFNEVTNDEPCDLDGEICGISSEGLTKIESVHESLVCETNSGPKSLPAGFSEKRSSPTIINVIQESNGNVDMNILSDKDRCTTEMSELLPSDDFDPDNGRFKTVKMLIRLGQLEGLDEKPPSFKPPPPPCRKNTPNELQTSNHESRQHSQGLKQELQDSANQIVVTLKHDIPDPKQVQNVNNTTSSPVLLKKTDANSKCSPSLRNAVEKNSVAEHTSPSPSATKGRDAKALSTFGSGSKNERNVNIDLRDQSPNLQPVHVKVTALPEEDKVQATEPVISVTVSPRFNIYGEVSSSSTEDILLENSSSNLSQKQAKSSFDKCRSQSPSPKEKLKKKKEAKKMSKRKKKQEEELNDKSYKIPEPLVEELEAKIKTRTLSLEDTVEEKETGEEQGMKETNPHKDHEGGVKERKHRWKSLWRKKPDKEDS